MPNHSCSSSSSGSELDIIPPTTSKSPNRPGLIPIPQPRFKYDASNSKTWSASDSTSDAFTPLLVPPTFAILTWNVDFSRDLPVHRLKTILNHLENVLRPDPNPNSPLPTIILFQEVHKSCFHALLSHPFVRATYDTTDTSPSRWSGDIHYGTVTLIPKSIASNVSVHRLPFPSSRMSRDVLYVDFEFSQPGPGSTNTETQKVTIRVANTHLESLPGHGDRARPVQLKSVSQLLSSPDIYGGVVGGDMNAISPSDVDLPERAGLSDAWVMTHLKSPVATPAPEGESDSDVPHAKQATSEVGGSHTWGHQPPSRFPPGRLDKILFVGGLKVDEIRRVGVGLECERPPGIRLGPNRPLWASDHYGLLAKFTIVEKDFDSTGISDLDQ